MKNLIVIIAFTAILFSCKKEEVKKQTENQNNYHLTITYSGQHAFGQYLYINGESMGNDEEASVTKGDEIKASLKNVCYFESSGQVCPKQISIEIRLDGKLVASDTCNCDVLEVTHKIQ